MKRILSIFPNFTFLTTKDGLIVTGIFEEKINSYYIKLLLIYVYLSFINYNTDVTNSLKTKRLSTKLNNIINNNQINGGNVIEDKIISLDFKDPNNFQLSTYNNYILKPIILHFENIFSFVTKKEEIYLSYIKFKNMYIIELKTEELIFDFQSISGKVKNRKIYKNEKLWQELIYHSKTLKNNYTKDYNDKYDISDLSCRFIKFECTSTYPRLLFIIKFIPILNGVSIIHFYSQKKLSRQNENNDYGVNKMNLEINIINGQDMKNNNEVEFKYSEPKKLQILEKFFLDFFICTRNEFKIFNNPVAKLNYFDQNLNSIIDNLLLNKKLYTYELFNSKVKLQLYDKYILTNNGEDKVIYEDKSLKKTFEQKDLDNSNTSSICPEKLKMGIKKHLFIKEIMKIINQNTKIEKFDQSISELSKIAGNQDYEEDSNISYKMSLVLQDQNSFKDQSKIFDKGLSPLNKKNLREEDFLFPDNSHIGITNLNILSSNKGREDKYIVGVEGDNKDRNIFDNLNFSLSNINKIEERPNTAYVGKFKMPSLEDLKLNKDSNANTRNIQDDKIKQDYDKVKKNMEFFDEHIKEFETVQSRLSIPKDNNFDVILNNIFFKKEGSEILK